MDDEIRGTSEPSDPDEPGDPAAKPAHLRRGGRARPDLVGPDGSGQARGPLAPGAEPGVEPAAEPEVEVEGLVEAGVEHGSVVLTGADGGTWQLGRSHAHLVGCTVAVRGRRRDVMTTAQQGVPFEVLALEVVAGTPGPPGAAPNQV